MVLAFREHALASKSKGTEPCTIHHLKAMKRPLALPPGLWVQVTDARTVRSLQDRLTANMDSVADEVNQWGRIQRGVEPDAPLLQAKQAPLSLPTESSARTPPSH